ncbi:MAG: branched-chain amino acid ABC transporter permease, partial [Actinomycetota bacterium]|nr:branched-chain amino acid ABC transporter permease [Actinomycetota bacterium]
PTPWSPSSRGWWARGIVLFVIFGGILLITTSVPGYWAAHISLAAVWAIIGLSLNVVLGYVGQLSLGHHGFIGIAAFVAAYYATEQAGCQLEKCSVGAFAAATFFAVLSGAVAAGLLGLVALRISGLYLSLITLAYGFMAQNSIFEISDLTRGGAGMPAPRPNGFTGDSAFAFLCFGFLALVLYFDWRLLKSKAGRAILSIKHSEPVAASYGINVTAYKVMAFVVSGVFAGLAGSLLAFHTENVVSNDFQFQIALLWVLMVIVGGLGNRTGVVIGSAFFALFPELIKLAEPVENFLAETFNRDPEEIGIQLTLVLGPLLAVVTMVSFPGGIAEQISPLTRWLRGQKFSLHPEGHGKYHEPKDPKRSLRKRKSEDDAAAPLVDAARDSLPPSSGHGTETDASDGAAPDETAEIAPEASGSPPTKGAR